MQLNFLPRITCGFLGLLSSEWFSLYNKICEWLCISNMAMKHVPHCFCLFEIAVSCWCRVPYDSLCILEHYAFATCLLFQSKCVKNCPEK